MNQNQNTEDTIESTESTDLTPDRIEQLAIQTYRTKLEAQKKIQQEEHRVKQELRQRSIEQQQSNFDNSFGKDLRIYLETSGGQWSENPNLIDAPDTEDKWVMVIPNSLKIGANDTVIWMELQINKEYKQNYWRVVTAKIITSTGVPQFISGQQITSREDLLAWIGCQLSLKREFHNTKFFPCSL